MNESNVQSNIRICTIADELFSMPQIWVMAISSTALNLPTSNHNPGSTRLCCRRGRSPPKVATLKKLVGQPVTAIAETVQAKLSFSRNR